MSNSNKKIVGAPEPNLVEHFKQVEFGSGTPTY